MMLASPDSNSDSDRSLRKEELMRLRVECVLTHDSTTKAFTIRLQKIEPQRKKHSSETDEKYNRL